MRRALLIGYYGRQNAGDDAFLAVSAWGARKFLGVERVWANASTIPDCCRQSVRPLGLPSAIPGAGTLTRFRRHWLLPQFQHLIFGGGSNFHTTRIIEDFIALVRAAGAGPHFALGISVGPFRDRGAAGKCAELLSMLDFVGLRDQASLDRVRELDLTKPAEYTFDIAPLLALALGTKLPVRPPPQRKVLAVALCNNERFIGGKTDEEISRLDAVAGAIRQCAHEGDCEEVVLVDMNGHPAEGDAAVHMSL
ncbi:MAG TPA: polysaccharide pyruvyl transferase family protein, partial [Verrucomicrobiae bacterium]|nr:polysaccharide pyruvyl transferase family protein [Verrucomicrobiae bacterium]